MTTSPITSSSPLTTHSCTPPPVGKGDELLARVFLTHPSHRPNPADVLPTVTALVGAYGGLGGMSRKASSVQRVTAAWLTYRRHFAPGPAWSLTSVDVDSATLTWHNAVVTAPVVIDVLCAGGIISRVHDTRIPAGAVLRVCDLVNPRDSLVVLADATVVSWTRNSDPFQTAPPTAQPAPTPRTHVRTSADTAAVVNGSTGAISVPGVAA